MYLFFKDNMILVLFHDDTKFMCLFSEESQILVLSLLKHQKLDQYLKCFQGKRVDKHFLYVNVFPMET
uniref:Uncharacterized protein n=1 Tax=Aliivibrio fischeri TaxID=668 RepID=H2ES70_ALIFS|nr:hypothetical protein [Aliivibrio fischeri]